MAFALSLVLILIRRARMQDPLLPFSLRESLGAQCLTCNQQRLRQGGREFLWGDIAPRGCERAAYHVVVGVREMNIGPAMFAPRWYGRKHLRFGRRHHLLLFW